VLGLELITQRLGIVVVDQHERRPGCEPLSVGEVQRVPASRRLLAYVQLRDDHDGGSSFGRCIAVVLLFTRETTPSAVFTSTLR
jgi:hypothetical protein